MLKPRNIISRVLIGISLALSILVICLLPDPVMIAGYVNGQTIPDYVQKSEFILTVVTYPFIGAALWHFLGKLNDADTAAKPGFFSYKLRGALLALFCLLMMGGSVISSAVALIQNLIPK